MTISTARGRQPSKPDDHEPPDEFRRVPHGHLPYDWTRNDG